MAVTSAMTKPAMTKSAMTKSAVAQATMTKSAVAEAAKVTMMSPMVTVIGPMMMMVVEGQVAIRAASAIAGVAITTGMNDFRHHRWRA